MGAPPPPVPARHCEKCGAAIALGTAFCVGCGAAVVPAAPLPSSTPVPDAVAGPAGVVVPPAGYVSGAPERQKFSFWVPVKLISVPVVAGLATFYMERGAPESEAFGFWIGMMLLPTLIAFLVVKFKPSLKMQTFSTVFCLVGVIGALVTAAGHTPRAGKTPQQIVREAAGTKPVDNSIPDSKVDRLLRDFLADMLAVRKKHDADAAPLTPVLSNLYSAESFSSRKQMEDAIAAVRKLVEVDGEITDKLQHAPQDFQARLDRAGLSPADREGAMRGFQQGFGDSGALTQYHEVRASEEKWADATVDLYNFALQHASRIKASGGKIVIADKAVLRDFNVKLKNSGDLRDKMAAANQHLVEIQAAALKKAGLTNSDLGLDKK